MGMEVNLNSYCVIWVKKSPAAAGLFYIISSLAWQPAAPANTCK